MERTCPALGPPFLRCFRVTSLWVRHLFVFHWILQPVTFFKIGSSSVSRLGTSYLLVRVVLVKKGLGVLKWNANSKPRPSGKVVQVMSDR